jgi:hypothetical protein
LEVSVHVGGHPPLFAGEWELRLNDIGGAKSLEIKQQYLDLEADRTSSHWMASNQLRLW